MAAKKAVKRLAKKTVAIASKKKAQRPKTIPATVIATPAQAASVQHVRAKAPDYSEDEKAGALETVIICKGNVSEAARQIGIARRTLQEWADGVNVSKEVYADYANDMRARVAERVEAIHATGDEVLSVYAIHLRGDIADFDGLIDDNGKLDLKGAKRRGVSRLVKKLRTVPSKQGPPIREIEFYSAKDAADSLAKVLGLNKQAAENPDTIERRKAFWRAQIEEIMADEELDEQGARDWLLMYVPAAKAERQYLM